MPRFGALATQTPSGVLGYTRWGAATFLDITATPSATPADIDATNLKVTFTVPPSGSVILTLQAYAHVSVANTAMRWCVRDGSTPVVGSESLVVYDTITSLTRVAKSVITGLTPGTTLTWKWAWYRDLGTGTLYMSTHTTEVPAIMIVEAIGGTIAATTDADVVPIAPNAQTGTTYTFVLADKHRLVTASNAAAQTYTIPLNATVTYPIGTTLQVYQGGVGQVTFAIAGGGTLRSPRGAKTAIQYGVASATKVGTDEWVVAGDVTV